MKVLQTPPRYSPFVGGVEAVAQVIAEKLVNAGDDVTVMCADEPRHSPERVGGIRVWRLRWPFKVANTNITPGLPPALARHDFDVVHTHIPTPWSADWSCVIGRLRRKRVVVTFHNEVVGTGGAGFAAWLYRNSLERLTLRLAHSVVVLSEPWKSRLLARQPHLRGKVHVIQNGVDVNRYQPPGAETRRSTDLLFVSVLDAFHDYKGLRVLLEALARVEEVRLQVVGEGSDRAKYELRASELGITDRVEFLGAVDQERLLALYQSAGVFVLPSNAPSHEGGSSLVVLEAMACGLPVIVADGAGEIAQEAEAAGAGICVAANDVEGLAGAIRELEGDSERRLQAGRRSREHVVAHHSWDAIVPKIRRLYEA